ncbi:hypothetical protein C0036_26655 [Streptomyces sp. DJ]|nr:hypothetical protein C0036_26655 [Streptomyces sp. DJ]
MRCAHLNCRRRSTSPGSWGSASIHVLAAGLAQCTTTSSLDPGSLTRRRPTYQVSRSPPGPSWVSTRLTTSASPPSPPYALACSSASRRLAMPSFPVAEALATEPPVSSANCAS